MDLRAPWKDLTSNIYRPPACIRDEMTKNYQVPWIDTTVGQNNIVVSPGYIPESWSLAEAVKFDAGGTSSATGGHQQQKLRRDLTSIYQFSPLPYESESIRILELLPGQRDEPIRARLQSCSLGNPPGYEAVSYAWGSKSDNAVITICDGEVDYNIELPRSLHGALKQLRHESSNRLIWADAICINQTDDKEKSFQVRLMRKVYQRAAKVVIWFGDDYETSCGTGSLFDFIGQMKLFNAPSWPPPEDQDFWTALGRLYRSPWLSRLWCLQEAVLAPSAEVMLGAHSAPWNLVGYAATLIRDMPAQIFQYNDIALVGVHNACLIFGLSEINVIWARVSFLQLLTLTRPFVASDFRDKIYAILGITTSDSDPDEGETLLEPDYTKTLSEVYIECSSVIIRKAIIRRTPILRLLSYVQHGQLSSRGADISAQIAADDTLIKVPSWVPHWHEYFARTLAPQELESTTFKASASLKAETVFKTHMRGLELITHGARITRVKSVSRIIENSKTWRHTSAETANELWVEFIEPLKALTADPTELFRTLSTLLTAGKDWFGGVIQDREQHFADFLAFMYHPAMLSDGDFEADLNQGRGKSRQTSRRDGSLSQQPNALQDLLFRPRRDLVLPSINKMGRAHCFQEGMRGACTWRRLVVTEDGHVGLGPQVTEPGDVVCILQDSIMPLILRPEAKSDRFKLVGEAYIQGMMFGELDIRQVEEIVLSDKPFVDLAESNKSGHGQADLDASSLLR